MVKQSSQKHYSSFNTISPRPAKPGLYLAMTHGRHHPDDQLSGWGFDGPSIGPLKWCHTTYATEVRFEFIKSVDAIDYFGKAGLLFELDIERNGLLKFRNKYYGDWTVYYLRPEDCQAISPSFHQSMRNTNYQAHQKYCL